MTTTWLEHAQAKSDISGFTLIGHHDLDGAGDGFQVIRRGDLLYVAHLGASAMALSILDISDLTHPRLLRQIPHPPGTRSHKVQLAGDVLIQNNERPYWASADVESTTGLTLYDISDPTDPKPVGFHPGTGEGTHRLWLSELPYAHIANQLPGGRGYSYEIVDVSDPSSPRSVGSWSVPGTFAGDPESWWTEAPKEQMGVHGAIPSGDRAYVSCFDAGMAIVDISDPTAPILVGRVNWAPPYGGFVHTSLPLPGRGLVVCTSEGVPELLQGGDKRIWIIDAREESHPVTISTLPVPRPPASSGVASYSDLPGVFGPHNLHENRPGSYISEEVVFATYSNAGLRAWDISDQYQPREIAHFVPPAPLVTGDLPDPRGSSLLNDLYVDADGIVFVTDRAGGGVYILSFDAA
jgi:hypothetical protein